MKTVAGASGMQNEYLHAPSRPVYFLKDFISFGLLFSDWTRAESLSREELDPLLHTDLSGEPSAGDSAGVGMLLPPGQGGGGSQQSQTMGK